MATLEAESKKKKFTSKWGTTEWGEKSPLLSTNMPRRGQEGVLTGLIPLSHKILAQTHSLQLNKSMSLCFLLHYTNNLSQLGQKKKTCRPIYVWIKAMEDFLEPLHFYSAIFFFNVPVSRCTHFWCLIQASNNYERKYSLAVGLFGAPQLGTCTVGLKMKTELNCFKKINCKS